MIDASSTCITIVLGLFVIFGLLFMIGWLEDMGETRQRQREIERKNAEMRLKKQRTILWNEVHRIEFEQM